MTKLDALFVLLSIIFSFSFASFTQTNIPFTVSPSPLPSSPFTYLRLNASRTDGSYPDMFIQQLYHSDSNNFRFLFHSRESGTFHVGTVSHAGTPISTFQLNLKNALSSYLTQSSEKVTSCGSVTEVPPATVDMPSWSFADDSTTRTYLFLIYFALFFLVTT